MSFPKSVIRARQNYAKWLASMGETCKIYRVDKDAVGLSTGPEAGTLVVGPNGETDWPCQMTYTPLGTMGEPMNNTSRRRTEMSIPGGTSRMSFAHPSVGGPVIELKDWLRTATHTYIVGVTHTEDPSMIDQECEVEVRRIPR